MALFVANATGNWSSTSSWATVRNTPTLHASSNVTITAGGITSATYTAPNTTNYVTGVAFFVTAVGSAGTLTATLRESGIDTAATVSVSVTSLKVNTWTYLKLAAPYQYTTTGANAYAWKLAISGGSGTTSAAYNSGATNFAFLSGDDLVSAVPTTGDDVFLAGNNLAALTITVDDTSRLVGSGTGTGTPSQRNITAAINISNSGKLAWSTTADSTLECKGQIEVNTDGYFNQGTSASPISSSYTAKLILNQNGTDGNYDVGVEASAAAFTMQGASRTYYKTTYSSGAGTAASPLIVSNPVDWNVNDEIVITGQGSYNQYEKRLIKIKNSTTSYVLCNTAGGAEAALTYSHDSDDRILVLTRNVVIESKTTTEYWTFVNKCSVDNAVDIDWAMVKYCGGTGSQKRGFQLASLNAVHTANCDYFVNYLADGYGTTWTGSSTTKTHTGLISYGNTTSSTVGGISLASAKNKTLVDCFAIGNSSIGLYLSGAANCTFEDCEMWNNNQNNNNAGGMRIDNSFSLTINSPIIESNRTQGIYLGGTANVTLNSPQIGLWATHTRELDILSDSYNSILFKDAILGAGSINNYLSMAPGSEILFNRLGNVDKTHKWYSAYGSAQSCGTGLSDTTVRTADSLSLRLSPEEAATGFVWEFKVVARAGYFVSASGFIKKNGTFGTDDIVVELYLPGSTVADDSYTMPDDTNWNAFNIGAAYAGSVDRFAVVKIKAKSATAGAYCYVDDIFNGTNLITALDVWEDAKPSPIMFEQLGDAAAVWAVSTSGLTTTGTTGKKLVDDLTTGKFLALK